MISASDVALRAIKDESMSRYQILIVALCTLIAALDGFDVLVVAYTGPAISAEWSLAPTSLGVLFGAGLAGMGIGAVTVAPIGDVIGRRPTIIMSLWILLIGMGISPMAHSVTELAWMRALTGVGIGAILANVNIMVSEYSSTKRKALCISIMSVGYPIGATLGGLIAVYLIGAFGWRSVYLFGAVVAALLLPFIVRYMPESLDYLQAKRPANALFKYNAILERMGWPNVKQLPVAHLQATARGARLNKNAIRSLCCASAIYFCVMMTCYFLLSWTPQILTRSGLTQNLGISGSLVMNLGGITGCILYGFFARILGARKLGAFVMIGLFAGAVAFAAASQSVIVLFLCAICVGVCLFSAISALYVLVPQAFAAQFRSTGTGIAMGAGRLGAVAGPVLAGYLIALQLDKTTYISLLALPMLLAAALVYWLRPYDEPVAESPSPLPGTAVDATSFQ